MPASSTRAPTIRITPRSCTWPCSRLVAGRTPHQAVEAFVNPFQRAVSCVTPDVLVASGRESSAEPHRLTVRHGDPAPLRGGRKLSLRLIQRYRVAKASGDPGPWTVTTAEYSDELLDQDERRVMAYHWHPAGRSSVIGPDVPLPQGSPFRLAESHPPTGWVSRPTVLRFAIEELGVRRLRQDWRHAIDQAEQARHQYLPSSFGLPRSTS